jgi:hypothetical protein
MLALSLDFFSARAVQNSTKRKVHLVTLAMSEA